MDFYVRVLGMPTHSDSVVPLTLNFLYQTDAVCVERLQTPWPASGGTAAFELQHRLLARIDAHFKSQRSLITHTEYSLQYLTNYAWCRSEHQPISTR